MAFVVFCSCLNISKGFDLPMVWPNDFTITLYQGGGMRYASTKLVLRADSGIYTEMENGKDVIKKFALLKGDKETILKQLKKLNVESIKTEKINGIVYDKETTQICFEEGVKFNHCFASSATEEIKKSHSKNFFDAYNYLLNFAQTKK